MTDKATISSQAEQIKLLKEKVFSLLEQLQKLRLRKTLPIHLLHRRSIFSRRIKAPKFKSKRKSGGGHKGHTLKMSLRPDKTIELKSNFCYLNGGTFLSLNLKHSLELSLT